MPNSTRSRLQTILDWLRGRSARRVLIGTVLVSILIAVALLGLLSSFRSSMHHLTRQSVRSILNSNLVAFETWRNDCETGVKQWIEDETRRTLAVDILDRYSRIRNLAPDLLQMDPEIQALGQSLSEENETSEPTLATDRIGWAIIDVQSRVIASDHDELLCTPLDLPPNATKQIIARKTIVTRPFESVVLKPDQKRLENSQVLAESSQAIVAALAPIDDGSRVFGAVAWLLDPRDGFSRMLSVSDDARMSETYAFDRRGVMLSESHYRDQLRAIGLINPSPTSSCILHLEVRDPGVDLTEVGKLTKAVLGQPLTFMADQATRGATGDNVVGYRDYRGVEVVGAWRWLPEDGFGVTTEIETATIYRPLRNLRWLVYALIGFLAAANVGFAGLVFWCDRLTRRLQPEHIVRRLGRYSLGRMIGRGAMGSVYSGAHEMLKREVAIKVLERDELTTTMAKRFAREVQLTARLRHPNTIAIYDYGRTDDGTFFYVMEYLEGISLQELIDDYGRQPADRVIAILLQICGSLAEAHYRGIVHRDIKPANVFLTAQAGVFDMVKVLDFGLVKDISQNTVEITQSESITGTPMYMSPESVRDPSSADARSDLYAVGAVGYALLTGGTMFDSGPSVDICLKQLNEEPMRPSDRIGVPLADDLQNVILSCLRKDAAQRPVSMDELADTLRHCRDHNGWSSVDAMRWWTDVFDGERVDHRKLTSKLTPSEG
ncbi:Serine/threonine-protein kinase PknB [Planctomycetes bacterium CA13]|uniref:Serine/threonine-protein kinase PknB n=1 Tax=Novipirellula herctigrandis TaxID=2527986 RepID=A0A5C5ZDA4_9BACT|nr:Serine/threonine-protein kinase PknB [Planctomycetes bacterium CA13]